MNVERKEGFSQVCVWPATVVGKENVEDFEKFMADEFKGTRVQYLEEIETFPNKDEFCYNDVEGTGGRNDLFFAVHNEDISKFAVPRLVYGIRWIEDVLAKGNYSFYPEHVFDYKTWKA